MLDIKEGRGEMSITGKKLIELIQKAQIEDFEIILRTSCVDETGFNLTDYTIDPVLLDVGYSDKIAFLKGEYRG